MIHALKLCHSMYVPIETIAELKQLSFVRERKTQYALRSAHDRPGVISQTTATCRSRSTTRRLDVKSIHVPVCINVCIQSLETVSVCMAYYASLPHIHCHYF
jgi:hypothetical protein